MLIGGIQKLTLIDYPKKVATIVFTVGCNFRCKFCYNLELVLPEKINKKFFISEKDFFDFLKSRKGKLEAVVITGGEPTLQRDLIDFIKKIKAMGFLVKLDTNGTNFNKLKTLLDKKLIDYVAMDIKNRLTTKSYEKIIDQKANINNIKKTISLIMKSHIDYEFRTTVAPGISKTDILSIARFIKGAKKYFLQKFKDTDIIDNNCKKDKCLDESTLELLAKEIKSYIKICKVR